MEIGILTYHRTINYGACLQAVATRIVLERLGHKVSYIDYWPEYHSQIYAPFSIRKLKWAKGVKEKFNLIRNSFKYGKYHRLRYNNFLDFIKSEIIPFCKPIDKTYDAIIYGSDQIWRKQPFLNDYNPIYFADRRIKAGKYIAFSASMGIMPTSEAEKDKIKILLRNFDSISVREKELKEYCGALTEKPITLTLDPTLLISSQMWSNVLFVPKTQEQKYVLVYALHDTFNLDSINEFAKNRGLLVKVLYGEATQADTKTVITTAGPVEFLKLIKNAEFVFASSFHGLAFSLIFEKEFLVSFENNDGRAISLLENVGLTERFISPRSNVPTQIAPIDYSIVNAKLSVLREHSVKFLADALL